MSTKPSILVLTLILSFAIGSWALSQNTNPGTSGPVSQTLHVDIVNGLDSNSGLGRAHALKSIQAAILKARTNSNDIIMVWPGIYLESINTLGKALTIVSAEDPAIIEGQTIAITCQTAENYKLVFQNLIIRQCETAILLINSSPLLLNMTIANNSEGIVGYGSSSPEMTNSILWNNRVDIACEKDDLHYPIKAQFSCFRHFNTNIDGNGNISQNPLFADLNAGDFHLRSERGRFIPYRNDYDLPGLPDPNVTQSSTETRGFWILDPVNSPCLDGGDPKLKPQRERDPNGGRVNMGAYGNTPYASLSEWPIPADINHDGEVNIIDAAIFSSQWLGHLSWCNCVGPPDNNPF